MTYAKIINKLAPCGLNCAKCFAYDKGNIKKLSIDLQTNLGKFDIYANRFVELLDEPSFKNYPDFKEMLNYFACVECKGCRNDECKFFTACQVKQCSKDHSVDFCFQCSEFPCSKHGFDEHLTQRWIAIQNKMEKSSVEDYYKDIKDLPRY